MDILTLIKNRRTIRKYTNKPIPKKILNKIIEAGRWGPSAHNSQPWEFVIIENPDTKKQFMDSLNNFSSKRFLNTINIVLRNTIKIIDNAPVIILVYNNHNLLKKSLKLGGVYRESAYISEIESISAAIQNMCLMAASLGIGTAWLTMPLLIRDKIKKNYRTNGELLAILTLGYPAEKGRRSPRKPYHEAIKFI